MDLLLPFRVTPSPVIISYTDSILCIGSCFSGEIGRRMKSLKFKVLQNPNGILYDPISIGDALESYADNKVVTDADLFSLDGLWHSWKHHSSFSGINKDTVLQHIRRSADEAHDFLRQANWLIITPGTAYNYRLLKTGLPVANCHKAPAGFFEKRLLTIGDIEESLSQAISRARELNPGLKIIFTISPVKHIRDGVIENNRSKARLIEAIHSLTGSLPNTFYFPAYELVTDILRDYRFYNSDMAHPSEAATEFVFEHFCATFLDGDTRELMKEIKVIVAAANHRPFHSQSNAHQHFIAQQLEKITKLAGRFPFLDFAAEEKYFSAEQL
jgi:GSCFA family